MDERLHKWRGREGSKEAMAVAQVKDDIILEIKHILHMDSSVFVDGLERDWNKDVSWTSGSRKQVMLMPLIEMGKTGLISSFEKSDP